MCMCLHVCACCSVRGIMDCHLHKRLWSPLRQGLSLTSIHQSAWTGWPANSRDLLLSIFLVPGLPMCATVPAFLMQVWENERRLSCLSSKRSTIWASPSVHQADLKFMLSLPPALHHLLTHGQDAQSIWPLMPAKRKHKNMTSVRFEVPNSRRLEGKNMGRTIKISFACPFLWFCVWADRRCL